MGLYLPWKLIDEIGLPRKELYDIFESVDYSKRAVEKGYQIYQANNSILQYKDKIKFKRIRILGMDCDFPNIPKCKWYYYMRNGILVFPKDTKDNILYRKCHLRLLFGVLLRSLNYFMAALYGYIDGLRRIEGRSKKY